MSARKRTAGEIKSAEKVRQTVERNYNKQTARGFKLNARTARKVERLINTPSELLRPFEVKYLEEFRTQAQYMEKARSYIANPGGVLMSKAKGLAFSQAKERTAKALASALDISNEQAAEIVGNASALVNPRAFINKAAKEGAKELANKVTEAAGLGDAGGVAVDVLASLIGKKKTTETTETDSAAPAVETVEEATEQPQETETSEEAQPAETPTTEATSGGTYFDGSTLVLDYEQTLIEELQEITGLFYIYKPAKDGSETGLDFEEVANDPEAGETYGLLDVSDLVAEGVDNILSGCSMAESDEDRTAYMKAHPYSLFKVKKEKATAPQYADSVTSMRERFASFVAWLS